VCVRYEWSRGLLPGRVSCSFFSGETSLLGGMNRNIYTVYFIYLYIIVSCSVYIASKCISC
jgi:hypothetical protein